MWNKLKDWVYLAGIAILSILGTIVFLPKRKDISLGSQQLKRTRLELNKAHEIINSEHAKEKELSHVSDEEILEKIKNL